VTDQGLNVYWPKNKLSSKAALKIWSQDIFSQIARSLMSALQRKHCKAKCGLKLTMAIHWTCYIWSYHAFKSNLERAGAVQTLKSVWGCYFDVQIVPGFLFGRFCGNLTSQGMMLLEADSRSLNQIEALSFVRIAISSKKQCSIKAN